MIISRTPLRLSFLGGGTDYPQFYNEHGGQVLVTAIDKFVYVTLHGGVSDDIYDLPTKSGLATSSAYTVGLLRACAPNLAQKEIASIATLWEREKRNFQIGSQDQYACAVGGFRKLMFDEHGVRDRVIDADGLSGHLMLFDTHIRRISGDVIASQLENVQQNETRLIRMMEMVDEGVGIIERRDWVKFGALLDSAWTLKKQLSDSVSTPSIDRIYEKAMQAGAAGGKLLGAGGGGFILFLVEPEKQEGVKAVLADLTHVPFEFEARGTEVIYSD